MRRAVAVALLLLASCGKSDVDPPGWTRLDNGLRFCVRRVEGATNVAVLTVFGIGSDHDPVGQSGLAHLVEHLYVTCAAGATPSRTSDAWYAAHPDGGSAATSASATQVLAVVAADELDAELADAAARLGDLRIEAADLDRERVAVLKQVVEEDADEDALHRARRAVFERLRPLPNGGRGIGVPAELAKLSLDDVRQRARRFYRPINARLVVAGAIDEAAALALVAKRFAGVERGERIDDPAPPGPPRPGTVELPDEAPRASGAPRERAVCVAYPATWTDPRATSALSLLVSRAFRSGLTVVPSEDVTTFVRTNGDEPVEGVLRNVDALIARFAKEPPTPEETASERKWMPRFTMDAPAGRETAPEQRSAAVAGRLAMLAIGKFDDLERLRAFESLTRDDLAGFAATRFDPTKRVVVVAWGAKRPAPPPFRPYEPPLDPALFSEVRVAMTWDETTQTIRRKLAGREYADDGELQKAIAAAHDVWVQKGKPDAPVTIDADARIPWKDVIDVVNLIKRCGINKIEFATGAPAKKPSPK